MGMVFQLLLKHLEVSGPSNHLTNGTWAMWDAQSPLATTHKDTYCQGYELCLWGLP